MNESPAESAFHLSVSACSRSKGQSAARKAAYVTGGRGVDPWTGKAFNYSSKQGVLRTGCVNYEGSPRELAQLMDGREARQNSVVCREAIVGLPHGLALGARWKLLLAHALAIAARWQVPVIAALHAPSARGDQRNDHGHLIFATRRIENGQLTGKTRHLDERRTGAAEILWLRGESARLIGEALEEAGRGGEKGRFDHRSYAARGIERPVTRHEGVRARAMARQGRAPAITRDNRALRAR